MDSSLTARSSGRLELGPWAEIQGQWMERGEGLPGHTVAAPLLRNI